jgi:hypothetical protein
MWRIHLKRPSFNDTDTKQLVPLADRNPQKFVNIYEADITDFQKATIRIHHDATNSSNIILPVMK